MVARKSKHGRQGYDYQRLIPVAWRITASCCSGGMFADYASVWDILLWNKWFGLLQPMHGNFVYDQEKSW